MTVSACGIPVVEVLEGHLSASSIAGKLRVPRSHVEGLIESGSLRGRQVCGIWVAPETEVNRLLGQAQLPFVMA